MNYNQVIELSNKNKYLIIDMIESEEKKYFLLTRVNQDNNEISTKFDLCIYNEEMNTFEAIDNEYEYNNIKTFFENRLNNKKQELTKLQENEMNLIKLKLINIDNYDYTFIDDNHNEHILNIEIFGNFKFELNDYIYINKETLNENITLRFGPIYTNDIEIIKIIREEEQFYLQRYYG